MPAPAAAVRADAETRPDPFDAQADQPSRTALYGGLVGGLIDEIEHRVGGAHGEQLAGPEVQEDVFHRVSVAAGYLGLAAGCAATVMGIAALF